MMNENGPIQVKPTLRGKSHLYATFLAIVAGGWLILRSASREAAIGAAIYSFTLVSLFAISAFYHVPMWPPKTRSLLRRFDLSAIFLLIAGTATPIFVLGLSDPAKTQALTLIWTGATVGILQSVFWTKAPKAWVAFLCVAIGWLSSPYLLSLIPFVGISGATLLVSGGIIYTLGALIYFKKKPNPIPGVFGFHELFHVFVIIAAACHYALIFSIISKN